MVLMSTGSSIKARLLSGSAWALGGKIGTALAGLATYALIARLLPPSELGVYSIAYSMVLLGGTVGTMGLNNAVVRMVAESMGLNKPWRARQIVKQVFILGGIGALVIGGIYWLAGDMIAAKFLKSPRHSAVGALIYAWIFVAIFQQLVSETFRGFHEISWATIFGGLASGLIFTGCLVAIWLAGQATLATVLNAAVGSAVAGVAAGGLVLFNKISKLPKQAGANDGVGPGEALSISWPLMIANLTHFAVTQADVWILSAFRSQEELAVYSAAARLITLVVMPLMLLNAVMPPIIAELHVQGKKEALETTLRSTAAIAGFPALIVLLAFVFLGKPILALIYGGFFAKGAMVLAILSIGQLVNVWAGSCGITLVMTGNQNSRMAIAVASAVMAIGGGVWAVQAHGMLGVAIASALTMICQNVAIVLYVKNKVGVWTYASFSGISWRSIRSQVLGLHKFKKHAKSF
jgi:O-antigen/teichoic acid export membrane protein